MSCTVKDCGRPAGGKGLCTAHRKRLKKHGSVQADIPVQLHQKGRVCAVSGCGKPYHALGLCQQHYHKTRSIRSYADAHRAVKRKRGLASDYWCAACGSQAKHWAYDHEDPNERTDDWGRPYSLDPEHYQPMCKPCHRKFDNEGDQP